MNNFTFSLITGWFLLIGICGFTGCQSASSSHDIPVVKNFEASRYLGTWHEIARLPKWFERGLTNVTAHYDWTNETLRITNRGFRNGKEKVSTAVGHFTDSENEGAFRISFFRPFYGDYRVIYLSSEYDLALVTGDDRSSLWILARTATIPTEKRDFLIKKAADWGFDVTQLEFP